MRTSLFALFALTATLLAGGDDARAVVDRSIMAAGGVANLAKFNVAIYKEKGTFYGMGEGLPYTGIVTMQFPDKFKMEIVGVFTVAVDGDKGWMNAMGTVKDLSKEELGVQHVNIRAGWMASLLPLRDKAFTLKLLPDAKVDGKDAQVVLATRKDYPDVKLYFDKKSNLVLRTTFAAKAEDLGFKEVTMENDFGDYKDVAGAKVPHKMSIRRDGKLFVESTIETATPEAKLDAKTFAKPE